MSLLILDPEQKQFFDDNGYLWLKGFYGPAEMEQMRGEFHRLVTEIEDPGPRTSNTPLWTRRKATRLIPSTRAMSPA